MNKGSSIINIEYRNGTKVAKVHRSESSPTAFTDHGQRSASVAKKHSRTHNTSESVCDIAGLAGTVCEQ